jgi:hypothetical protein
MKFRILIPFRIDSPTSIERGECLTIEVEASNQLQAIERLSRAFTRLVENESRCKCVFHPGVLTPPGEEKRGGRCILQEHGEDVEHVFPILRR